MTNCQVIDAEFFHEDLEIHHRRSLWSQVLCTYVGVTITAAQDWLFDIDKKKKNTEVYHCMNFKTDII